jgi:RNA polymerase sigma factor (sigma-70 family)
MDKADRIAYAHRTTIRERGAMEPNDADLIRACRAGDEAAWDVLVERYQKLVYTIGRRAGLEHDQASEVFQRVFATLVEQLDNIERPEQIGAWLVTTARRESWRLRRRERTSGLVLGNAAEQLRSVQSDYQPDERLLRLEEQDAVRAALDVLDGRCRRLLMLLFETSEPPSYAAVAAALGMSAGSVGPTRARCLEKLRRIFEQLDA